TTCLAIVGTDALTVLDVTGTARHVADGGRGGGALWKLSGRLLQARDQSAGIEIAVDGGHEGGDARDQRSCKTGTDVVGAILIGIGERAVGITAARLIT